jgi:hypothetical protein
VKFQSKNSSFESEIPKKIRLWQAVFNSVGHEMPINTPLKTFIPGSTLD